MKYLIALILLLTVLNAKCQLIDSCYLNFEWNTTTKKEYSFYIKERHKTNVGYKVLIFKNPKIKKMNIKTKEQVFECNYKSLNPEIEDGYFNDGIMKGNYSNGEITGEWFVMNEKGDTVDTLDYSFKIVNHKFINKSVNIKINQTENYDSTVYWVFGKDLYYPPIERVKNIDCKMTVSVKTNTNGDITEVLFENSCGVNFEKEVVRVLLNNLPKYKDWEKKFPVNFLAE